MPGGRGSCAPRVSASSPFAPSCPYRPSCLVSSFPFLAAPLLVHALYVLGNVALGGRREGTMLRSLGCVTVWPIFVNAR